MFWYKSIIFILLIANGMNGMMTKINECNTSIICLDEVHGDILFMIGKQLLPCYVKNEHVEMRLKEWAGSYPPIKYFTYLNLIMNYAIKYPSFINFNGFNEKRDWDEIFMKIKPSEQSDFFKCMNLIKEVDIRNKILFKKPVSRKEYQLIVPLLNKEILKDYHGNRIIYVKIKRSLSKKVIYCFFFFIGFNFLSVLLYIPVFIYCGVIMGVGIYIFGSPIIYFLGDRYIQEYSFIIFNIAPVIWYVITLYDKMEEIYKMDDDVHISN